MKRSPPPAKQGNSKGRQALSGEYLWWRRATVAMARRDLPEALSLVRESRSVRQTRGLVLDQELVILDQEIARLARDLVESASDECVTAAASIPGQAAPARASTSATSSASASTSAESATASTSAATAAKSETAESETAESETAATVETQAVPETSATAASGSTSASSAAKSAAATANTAIVESEVKSATASKSATSVVTTEAETAEATTSASPTSTASEKSDQYVSATEACSQEKTSTEIAVLEGSEEKKKLILILNPALREKMKSQMLMEKWLLRRCAPLAPVQVPLFRRRPEDYSEYSSENSFDSEDEREYNRRNGVRLANIMEIVDVPRVTFRSRVRAFCRRVGGALRACFSCGGRRAAAEE